MSTDLLERPTLQSGSGAPPKIPDQPTITTGGVEPTWSGNDVKNVRRIARMIENGEKLELTHGDAVTLHIVANLIESGEYCGEG